MEKVFEVIIFEHENTFTIGYGREVSNGSDGSTKILFNLLCDGLDRGDFNICELAEIIVSVSESIKLTYPDLDAKIREQRIAFLRKNKTHDRT